MQRPPRRARDVERERREEELARRREQREGQLAQTRRQEEAERLAGEDRIAFCMGLVANGPGWVSEEGASDAPPAAEEVEETDERHPIETCKAHSPLPDEAEESKQPQLEPDAKTMVTHCTPRRGENKRKALDSPLPYEMKQKKPAAQWGIPESMKF